MEPRGLAPAGPRFIAGVARKQKAVLAELFHNTEKSTIAQAVRNPKAAGTPIMCGIVRFRWRPGD